MLICLRAVCGCSHATTSQVSSCDKIIWPTEPITWLFIGKCARPFVRSSFATVVFTPVMAKPYFQIEKGKQCMRPSCRFRVFTGCPFIQPRSSKLAASPSLLLVLFSILRMNMPSSKSQVLACGSADAAPVSAYALGTLWGPKLPKCNRSSPASRLPHPCRLAGVWTEVMESLEGHNAVHYPCWHSPLSKGRWVG